MAAESTEYAGFLTAPRRHVEERLTCPRDGEPVSGHWCYLACGEAEVDEGSSWFTCGLERAQRGERH